MEHSLPNTSKPFAIRRLVASQIGPFTDLDIDFWENKDPHKAEIHILTGDNGTGKSTILHMLANCLPGGSALLYDKLRNPRVSNYTLNFSDGTSKNYDGVAIKPVDELVLRFNKQLDKYVDYPQKLIDYFMAEEEDSLSIALFAYSGNRTIGVSTVENLTGELPHPVQDVLDFNRLTDTGTFTTWLASTLTNIALIQLSQNANDNANENLDQPIDFLNYQVSLNELERVISTITGKQIRFKFKSGIPLKITLDVDGQQLTFSQLPDGLKSIISWLGDLLMRLHRIDWKQPYAPTQQSFILFLDEIEVHLHPAWQRRVLPAIQGLFPNAQVFISTHSPFVVGSVDGAWVHRLLENGQHNDPVLSEDSHSYQYILSELFGVPEQFGLETTEDFRQFYVFKQQILTDQPYDKKRFEQLMDKFREQSREVQSIIGMELRQLTRLTNQSFI